ncbi:MAG TPA: tRNA lysidine(34) synthetase TilS, partial [Collinsella ihuae]|nr:tRNA lysidine(34) synthetase TilS [Collinsella ihumii]
MADVNVRDVVGAIDIAMRRMESTIAARGLAGPETPVVLMVSGGSDSTALAYLASGLSHAGFIGPARILHVNHLLRGEDADADARFVEALAKVVGVPADIREVDVGAIAAREGGNVEAVGRRVRYAAAAEALAALCREASVPVSEGRILTAHTADDRVESFYMRSIVGTGPGGFRAMRYRNGSVVRPLLDTTREDLRACIDERDELGFPVARDEAGALWREDATNAHTDRFRAFVRHEIVPLARDRNPRLHETLCRTMNLIADEDDLLEGMAADIEDACVTWERVGDDAAAQGGRGAGGAAGARADGAACAGEWSARIAPSFAAHPLPLRRRVATRVLKRMLPPDARVESASVKALLDAFRDGAPNSGYVA